MLSWKLFYLNYICACFPTVTNNARRNACCKYLKLYITKDVHAQMIFFLARPSQFAIIISYYWVSRDVIKSMHSHRREIVFHCIR